MPDISKKKGIRDRFYIALHRDQEMLTLKSSDIQVDGDVSSLNIVGKGTRFRVTPLFKEVTFTLIAICKNHVSLSDGNAVICNERMAGVSTVGDKFNLYLCRHRNGTCRSR